VQKFPELDRIHKLITLAESLANITELGVLEHRSKKFPIFSFSIGSKDPRKPVLVLVGGVHGLERIGAQTVLAYLESLFEQLRWDEDLRRRFQDVRLVSVPVVNPVGTFFGMRSNGNGVDLMRNAPIDAQARPAFLIGGHRVASWLPYYRGPEAGKMELETEILCRFIREQTFESEATMIVDVHSGFGLQDRLWYPYAKTAEPFPQIAKVEKLKHLLDRSYPNHVYLVEPQSLNYTTHGDIWDYLFDEHQAHFKGNAPLFIPWTLEMGSWNWVRKNPLQILSAVGRFNPIKTHRYKRIMRRHIPLFDFFLRAIRNHDSWAL
jgi:hypothetical protein